MSNAKTITVPEGHDVAMIVFDPPREGDCLSKQLMQEIQRRMHVFTLKPGDQIVRSVQPPNDKTVYWLPIDESGNVNGLLKGYDAGSGTWIDVSSVGACVSADPNSLLGVDSNGCLIVVANKVPGYAEVFDKPLAPTSGATSVDLTYQNFLDAQAEISVMFLGDPGAGSRWWLTDVINTGCTVNFAGLAGALTARIIARRSVKTT